jgi:hypothetical protein
VQVASDTEWRYDHLVTLTLLGGEKVDMVLDVQQAGTDVQAVPMVQYYPSRSDVPGTLSLFTGTATTGRLKYSETLSSGTNMVATLGVATRLSNSQATFGQGLVRAYWAKTACGYQVGAATVQFEGMAANAPSYLLLGRKLPTRGVEALKAAVHLLVSSADVYTRLMVRLYGADPQVPGPWLVGLEAQYTTQTPSRNTGELATSGVTGFSGAMWYDLGVQIMSPSANTVASVAASAVAKL